MRTGRRERSGCRAFLLRSVYVSSVLCVLCALCGERARSAEAVHAIVLGIAQDGGVPHIGCTQELCVAARRDPAKRQRVASLGLVDGERRFLIDATPDLASQLESLNAGRAVPDGARPLDGILLTHAHMGHYLGLLYLGREALGARAVPVHATPRMARFLRENGPWSQLVALGNVELREMQPGREWALSPNLRVTALAVPHRDEWSDTVAFRVRGPSRSLLYLPDVDKWERWDRRIEDEAGAVDAALLDGTFAAADEIAGRSLAEIPHPLVGETLHRLAPLPEGKRVLFIHLNHTNAYLSGAGAPLPRGFEVARDGMELAL
jgi:pyrroloquinoline quinone biosynthesis protein B